MKIRCPRHYWICAIGFAAFIFILSSIPGSFFNGIKVPVDEKFIPFSMRDNPDKFVHAFLYATFGWLWLRAFALGNGMKFPKAAIIAFIATALYGISDELHQLFTPDRYCDLNDWLADCIGGLLTIVPLSFWYQKIQTQNSSSSITEIVSAAPMETSTSSTKQS